jgi:hypothetical protein
MKVFKTSAPLPTLDSMLNPDIFDDIQEFYDFYLESIKEKMNSEDENDLIHSEILSSTGTLIEFILDKENYHLCLKRCEIYYVMTEEYEKANECLKLLKRLRK